MRSDRKKLQAELQRTELLQASSLFFLFRQAGILLVRFWLFCVSW